MNAKAHASNIKIKTDGSFNSSIALLIDGLSLENNQRHSNNYLRGEIFRGTYSATT